MELDHLFSASIPPDEAPRIDPRQSSYTIPRTFGVYKIESDRLSTKRYRFGNHPVRYTELRKEYSAVRCIALYFDRSLAKQLASALNK